MVILGSWNGRSLTLSVKPNCLTLSVQGDHSAEVISFDYAGRLWTAMLDNISLRRGLDGKFVAKWQTASGGRDRRWLAPTEARQVEARARQLVNDLQAAAASGQARFEAPLSSEARQGFAAALAFDAERSQADIARYHQVYRPVGILPPDQYGAVVLQATEGCAFNTCTFCNFYRDRPFRIKTPEQLRQHAQAVKDFLGPGLSLRRTIFLGDANALIVPQARLLPLIDAVHAEFDVEKLGGLYAFLDGFSGEKKSPTDYAQLVERGVKRIYVGLESGNEKLLTFLKKPGRPADVVKAVQAMKTGGMAVGVIVLLGAGGKAYAKAHARDTIRALNAMNLDMDDLIYFSELVEHEGIDYSLQAFQDKLKPLSPLERIAQGEQIERGLKFSPRGGVPHISRYDIREFVY